MANSYISYTGDGSTTAYSIPFPFIAKGHLVAKVNGVTKTQDTDYTVSGSTLTFGTAPASSASIHISRSTPKDEMLVNFVDGAVITADDLDTAQTQTFYGLQEVQESSIQADPENYDAVERRIVNVADPEDDQDAATKAYVDGEIDTLDAAKEDVGTAASAVATHAALTATHGVSGAIVGTTNTQTLTNKTISGSSNTLSNIPQSAITDLESDIATAESHAANTSNPHSVTATQVGLGNVPNYGVASQAEAEAGTATDKLMTPLRVAQAIEELAPPAGGNVVGPASSTDNAFARYDGTTGELLQNSYLKEDDSGLLTMAGQTNGGDVPTAYRVLSSVDSGIGAVHGLYCIRQSYAPTTSEGASSGFGVGSRWIDTTTDKEYVCLDSTNGAAVWKETTGSSGGDLVSTNNLSDLDNAATARTNLGLAIGTDVQAYDAQLADVASLTYSGNALKVIRVNAGETALELATPSGGGSGKVAQVVTAQSTTEASTTANVPNDTTIPQVSEMTSYASLDITITPTNASSTIIVEFQVSHSAAALSTTILAIFKDSDTSAVKAWGHTVPAANYLNEIPIRYIETAGSTSARTYKLYFACNGGTTAQYINQNSAALFGTAALSTATVWEILP